MYWSGLRLPYLELDWFLDVCSRITHLDLSSNSLAALPSVVPWGLIHLRTLDLSDNVLKELPFAQNSQDVICSRYVSDCVHKYLYNIPRLKPKVSLKAAGQSFFLIYGTLSSDCSS